MPPSARFLRRSAVCLAALSTLACESAEERSNEVFIVDYAPSSIETKVQCEGVEARTTERFTLGAGGRIVERLVEDADAAGAVTAARRLTYAHDALGRIVRIDVFSGEPANPAEGRRWRLVSTTGRAWDAARMTEERTTRYDATGVATVEHVRTHVLDADGHLTAISHAIHDAAGRRTAASEVETDAEGRLIELRLDDTTRITWTRDAQGRVTRETRTTGETVRSASFTYTGDYVTTARRTCESDAEVADCDGEETETCEPTVDAQGMLTTAECTGQNAAGCAVTRTLTYTREGRSASVDLAPEGWPTHRTELLLRDADDLAQVDEH